MATPEPTLQPVGGAGQFSGAGPCPVSAGGVDLVVLRAAGKLRAFEGRCPHQGALLGEGEIDGDHLVCRNHQWRFNIETGARAGGMQILRECAVVERDGQVLADVASMIRSPAAQKQPSRAVQGLPGPRGVPLLGNILQLRSRELHLGFEAWAAEYGPMYLVRLGRRPVVVVSDPRLSVQILRARPETFRRASSVATAFDSIGISGVFSAEGADWRPQRRLAMEALSQRNLRNFFPTLQTVGQRLLRRLRVAADRGETVDVVEEMKRLTVDVTTFLTFGRDVNTIEQAGADIIQRQLGTVFPVLSRRAFLPVPLWRVIRLPSDRRVDRAIEDLRAWLAGPVAEARARVAAEPDRAPTNFLEAMLADRDSSGASLSDQMIFGNLMNMLLAGEDTTAYTLAWAIHHLCDHAPAVSALGEELERVLGREPVPSSLETTDRLDYAAAIANEAMRLRPVAPLLFLESIVDTTLDDLLIPSRTLVLVATRPPVLDAAHFDRPSEFHPQRWLNTEPHHAHDPSAHFPFGSGPRVCPGRSLALLEMKLVLATVYKNFQVERIGDATDVREEFSFTMMPRGLKVRLRHRD